MRYIFKTWVTLISTFQGHKVKRDDDIELFTYDLLLISDRNNMPILDHRLAVIAAQNFIFSLLSDTII